MRITVRNNDITGLRHYKSLNWRPEGELGLSTRRSEWKFLYSFTTILNSIPFVLLYKIFRKGGPQHFQNHR